MPDANGRQQIEASAVTSSLIVRRLVPADVGAMVAVWHESKQVAYPYLPLEQGLTLADDERFFREHIWPANEIWVATLDETVVAFLAMQGSYIDRLYVQPERQNCGIGSALMDHAKSLSPAGVELHTHQKNAQARAFYEKHGFRAVKFGVSPPPESEPDVEYHWRPAQG
jgi:ribosomal protein S18 acetylase RimI-like enzyme